MSFVVSHFLIVLRCALRVLVVGCWRGVVCYLPINVSCVLFFFLCFFSVCCVLVVGCVLCLVCVGCGCLLCLRFAICVQHCYLMVVVLCFVSFVV